MRIKNELKNDFTTYSIEGLVVAAMLAFLIAITTQMFELMSENNAIIITTIIMTIQPMTALVFFIYGYFFSFLKDYKREINSETPNIEKIKSYLNQGSNSYFFGRYADEFKDIDKLVERGIITKYFIIANKKLFTTMYLLKNEFITEETFTDEDIAINADTIAEHSSLFTNNFKLKNWNRIPFPQVKWEKENIAIEVTRDETLKITSADTRFSIPIKHITSFNVITGNVVINGHESPMKIDLKEEELKDFDVLVDYFQYTAKENIKEIEEKTIQERQELAEANKTSPWLIGAMGLAIGVGIAG